RSSACLIDRRRPRWPCHLPKATVNSCRGFPLRTETVPQPGSIPGGRAMRRLLLIVGMIALAIGLLWIGQGTGVGAWPRSSFMINEIQWAGYGAALSAVGLILIWQSQR